MHLLVFMKIDTKMLGPATKIKTVKFSATKSLGQGTARRLS
jgi:hypothetical protein